MTPAALLAWFDTHQRPLPWRRSREPYPILVSELMLQQTRVDVVIPYFERFLERFPDLQSLAASPLEPVLAAWTGLGYYRRARQLWQAARGIMALGAWPRRAVELEQLPGIGPYTAAAVASQAFGEPVPCLDGNVRRVIARLLGRAEAGGRAAEMELRAAAATLLAADRPGDSNQALMELGATVCTPRRPACGCCPLEPGCAAAASGAPERFPAPRPRAATARIAGTVLLLEDSRGRLLLGCRPPGAGLLAGLWEPPWTASRGLEAERDLRQRYGLAVALGPTLGLVRHNVTHHLLALEVRSGELLLPAAGEVAEGVATGWFDREERTALGATSLLAKALALARPPALAATGQLAFELRPGPGHSPTGEEYNPRP